MFKRKIELDKNYLEKLSLAFEQMFKEQMSMISPDKKILVLCTELHGNYKIQQLEKCLLKGMRAAGLSVLYSETPQESGSVIANNIEKIAKDKYDMLVEPVDVHPMRESASVFERNVFIKDKIVALNQPGVFITGRDHLQSLLEEGEAQIPTSLFHVIPINLTSIIQSQFFENNETAFASDSSKVIQLRLNNEKCFTEIEPVIDYWNGSNISQNNKVKNHPESQAQNFKIGDVLLAIDKKETKPEKQSTLLRLIQEYKFSVEDFNLLYNELKKKEGLNTHRNPRADWFFGIQNTTSWRNTLGELRNTALEILFKEVEDKDSKEEKLRLLEYAKTLPLFREHRNNSILEGAWGRTAAVKQIEEQEEKLQSGPSLDKNK